MIAQTGNVAVVQYQNDVCIHHRGDALGDDHLGGVGQGGTQRLPDAGIGGGIYGGGAVIQNEDFRLLQE